MPTVQMTNEFQRPRHPLSAIFLRIHPSCWIESRLSVRMVMSFMPPSYRLITNTASAAACPAISTPEFTQR